SLVVLVVAAPPYVRLVAPSGRAIEPLVHRPQAVEPARVRGIGVIDDAVLERECARTRPFARVRGNVGSGRSRHLRNGPLHPGPGLAPGRRDGILAREVVFDAAVALLL